MDSIQALPVTLRLRNVTFRRSLDLIFTEIATPQARLIAAPGLDCIAIAAVRIYPSDKKARQPEDLSLQAAERLDRMLPAIHFAATPLSQVLALLAKESDVPFVINWQGVERAGIGRDMPVTLELKDTSVSRCLGLICDLVSSDKALVRYTIDQGIVTVSTPESLRLAPFEEKFNLHDLLGGLSPDAAAARETAILELITKTIAPDAWYLDGTKPNIRIEGNRLIVIQPDEIQRQIPDLLSRLWRIINPGPADLPRRPSTDPQK